MLVIDKTFCTLAMSRAASTERYHHYMERVVREVVSRCKDKCSSKLLMRYVTIGKKVNDEHDFQAIEGCQLSGYYGSIRPRGELAITDCSVSLIEQSIIAAKTRNYDLANALLIMVVDGQDTFSENPVSVLQEEIEKAFFDNSFESFLFVLIGINIGDRSVGWKLSKLRTESGFNQYVEFPEMTEEHIPIMTEFIVDTIVNQCKARGTGVCGDLARVNEGDI